MSKYAVIRLKGRQYTVEEKKEILVDKLDGDKLIPEVLLFVDDKKVKVGKPILKNVKVALKIVKDEEKGDKVTVLKYRAKSRYRRKMGFRPVYSRLLVKSIG